MKARGQGAASNLNCRSCTSGKSAWCARDWLTTKSQAWAAVKREAEKDSTLPLWSRAPSAPPSGRSGLSDPLSPPRGRPAFQINQRGHGQKLQLMIGPAGLGTRVSSERRLVQSPDCLRAVGAHLTCRDPPADHDFGRSAVASSFSAKNWLRFILPLRRGLFLLSWNPASAGFFWTREWPPARGLAELLSIVRRGRRLFRRAAVRPNWCRSGSGWKMKAA